MLTAPDPFLPPPPTFVKRKEKGWLRQTRCYYADVYRVKKKILTTWTAPTTVTAQNAYDVIYTLKTHFISKSDIKFLYSCKQNKKAILKNGGQWAHRFE